MMRGLFTLAALLLLSFALPQQVVAADDDFKACRGDKADINVLLGVPRVNLGMGAVSNNLAEYEAPVQTCADDPEAVCEADWLGELNAEQLLDQEYGSANPDSWINYAQGLIMYAFIGVAFAVCTVIFGIVALCIRCCCCKGVGVAVSEDPDKDPYYPMWQTVSTYFCLAFFIIMVFTFTLLAHIRGNQGFTDAQLALVDAPDNIVALAQGAAQPAVDVLTDVLGNTTINLITRVNTTFFEAGSIAVLHESVLCAREMYDELTNASLVDGFLQVLDDIEASIIAVPEAANVSGTIAGVRSDVDALLVAVEDAETQIETLQTAFAAVNLTDIEQQTTALSGEITTVRTQLQSMETALQAYADVQTDIAAVDSDITPLLSPDYLPAMASDFQTSFATFQASFGALPTEAAVSSQLLALNSTLDNLDARLETLEDTLGNAQTALSGVNLGLIETSLDNIIAAIDGFNLTALQEEVDFLLGFAQALPSVAPLTDKIDEILALEDLIPCVFNASTVPQDINDNLVELPAEVLNITSQFEVLNETVANARTDLELALNDIDSFASSFNGTLQATADDFTAQIVAAEATLASARALAVALRDDVTAADPGVLDVSAAITTIGNTRAAIADPGLRPTDGTITAINAAAGPRGLLTTQLNALASNGFGGRVAAVAGNPVSDWNCPGGTPMCWDRSAGSSPNPCPGFCDYPHESWTALQGALAAFTAAISAVSPPISGQIAQLQAADTAAANADLSCCTDLSSVQALQATADGASTDIASAKASIEALNASLAALETDFLDLINLNATIGPQLDAVRAQLLSFNATTLLGDLDTLERFFEREDGAWGLLTVGLNVTFTELRTDRLREIANGPLGVEGVLRHVANELDLAVAQVEPEQATLAQRLEEYIEYARLVDAIRDSDGSTRAVGSIYYLQRTVATATNQSGDADDGTFPRAEFFDQYERPTALGFVQDGELKAYPGDVRCLTDACLRASVDYYNNEPIADVLPADVGEALPVSIPVSRTTLTGLPFIIPGLVLLTAVGVFFLPQCGYVLACCSVCIAPWLFVLFGALIFPLLLLTADVCASAEGVGVKVLQELTPALCAQANGTLAPSGFCVIIVDQPPLGNKTIELDAPELLQSLLLDCSGSSAANVPSGGAAQEPVGALIQSFGLEAGILVQNQLADLLDNTLPELGVVLRPLLRADVEASQGDLTGDVQQLANSIDSALGCQKVSDAYLGLKDTVCCDFASAFYWSIAGWYLIAFSMLLCGLPVGCFAATRLRNIKRSRAQLREFYARTGSTIAGSAVGRATAAAYARVVHRDDVSARGSEDVIVAEPVNVEPRRRGESGGSSRQAAARQKLGQMGAAVGSSFRRGKQRAQDSARTLQQRMRDLAHRRERVAENESRIAALERGESAAHEQLRSGSSMPTKIDDAL